MTNKRSNATAVVALIVLAAFPAAAGVVAAGSALAEVRILDWDVSGLAAESKSASKGGAGAADYAYTCNGITWHFNIPVNFYCNGVLIPPDGEAPPPPPPPPPPTSTQSTPWGISAVGAQDAWSTTTGATVKVAVIDTGIQSNHPDLKDNLKGGVRFYRVGSTVYSDSKWEDDHGHGTHVAGTIAAQDNLFGVVGVAPKVELYAVKVLDASGSGTWSEVAKGIRWAADNGMNVASMSLGGSTGSQALADAVAYAYSKGVVLVAAAGNAGDGNPLTTERSYPAAYSQVIAVGAVDSRLRVASFSSSASYLTLCAPGVSVASTYKGSTYKPLSGTSMATPHVSAVAALVMSVPVISGFDNNQNGKWDPSEVKARLRATADDLGVSAYSCGSGLVSASAAVA